MVRLNNTSAHAEDGVAQVSCNRKCSATSQRRRYYQGQWIQETTGGQEWMISMFFCGWRLSEKRKWVCGRNFFLQQAARVTKISCHQRGGSKDASLKRRLTPWMKRYSIKPTHPGRWLGREELQSQWPLFNPAATDVWCERLAHCRCAIPVPRWGRENYWQGMEFGQPTLSDYKRWRRDAFSHLLVMW
jgi:hypothetical protein